MKTRIYILLGIIAIAFSSCNISSTSNNTPEILFVTNPFINKTDTLSKYYTDESGVYRMDTIQVGDTVTFRMLFYGYSNNLSSFNLSQSDTSATKILLPATISLDSIFVSAGSDYTNGKFLFKSKISSLYFPFRYVAKKVTNDAKITFYLSSDATFSNTSGFGNNSTSFELKTPIVLKKQSAVKHK